METRAQKCLRDYNPLGLEDYQDVVARWLGALLVLAAHVAAHPVASSAAHDAGQSQQPLPPVKPNQQDLARCPPVLASGKLRVHQLGNVYVPFMVLCSPCCACSAWAMTRAHTCRLGQTAVEEHQRPEIFVRGTHNTGLTDHFAYCSRRDDGTCRGKNACRLLSCCLLSVLLHLVCS